MTKQEIFDTVARHLAAQGYRATDSQGHCKYRTPLGDKCAAGCVIPDNMYAPHMEGTSVRAWHNFFGITNIELCVNLQNVHDNESYWTPENMLKALRRVASLYALDPAILDKLDFGLIIPNRLDI